MAAGLTYLRLTLFLALGIRDTEGPLGALSRSVLSRDAQGEIVFPTDKKKHGEVLFPTQVRSCFIIAFGPLIFILALLKDLQATCQEIKPH